jgi:predicted metal-binding protein
MEKLKSHPGAARLIPLEVSEEVLQADLERYRQLALESGASQAKIIPARWAEVDERVRLKCMVPPCPHYGRVPFCPPHSAEPDFMRRVLSRFHWAVLFKSDVPVEYFADVKQYYPRGQEHQRKALEIAAKIEVTAFGDGYYFAVGFGSGCCRDTLCGGTLCAMMDSGRCPYELVPRPSMESVGIDVFGLATRVGWDVYPIYRSVDPKAVPSALTVGIVFVH